MNKDIINDNLVTLDFDADNFESVIEHAGRMLHTNGYVKDSYINAVIEREKVFPTGLMSSTHTMAMPHTDPSHVIEAGVSFVRTNKPISVSMMGDLSTKVNVSMFFVLAISNPEEYMSFLSQLMGLFQDKENLDILSSTNSKEDVVRIISKLNV